MQWPEQNINTISTENETYLKCYCDLSFFSVLSTSDKYLSTCIYCKPEISDLMSLLKVMIFYIKTYFIHDKMICLNVQNIQLKRKVVNFKVRNF